MLARDHSLSSKKDIDLVKKQGKLVSSESFSFCYMDHENQDKPRFAFVISTKISKLATVRVKARRSLSEGVRHILVYLKPGIDVVFLAKPGIERKYTDSLMNEVKVALEKEGLFK
jgi:ribonuclease P protein component